MAKLLGGTRIYGTGTVDSTLYLNSTATASSTITGALIIAGGVGIGGNLYVGGNIVGNVVGYAGSFGYTGSFGLQGYSGSRGYTGSFGLQGYTGSFGLQGYTGSFGLQGYSGSRGYTGSGGLGYSGSIGYTGSGGLGYSGSFGYTGSGGLGYSGSFGYTGSSGASGAATTINATTSNLALNYYVLGVTTPGASATATITSLTANQIYFTPASGSMYAIDFLATSDARYKNVTSGIPNAVDIVKKLKGIKYFWNDYAKRRKGLQTNDLQVGLIAQDVQAVLPEAVGGTPDDLSIKYDKIIPLLVEAIKELTERVERLEKR